MRSLKNLLDREIGTLLHKPNHMIQEAFFDKLNFLLSLLFTLYLRQSFFLSEHKYELDCLNYRSQRLHSFFREISECLCVSICIDFMEYYIKEFSYIAKPMDLVSLQRRDPEVIGLLCQNLK